MELALDPTRAFIRKRDEIDNEWLAEVIQLVNGHAARLNELEQNEARARILEDDEVMGITANYFAVPTKSHSASDAGC